MRTGWQVAGGVAAALVVFTALEAQQAEPRRIAAAPAFDARRLTANPTRDWITNGGNVFNQRYSPLTRLDRGNVGDLKALWRTSMGTGANPNNSGQAQILHHDGTLYVINGANDVFALDVDTGAILWTYRGTPEPRAGVPMGRSSRGGNKVTMELPVSDEERSPSHIKRWTFDMNSKSDGFAEEVMSRSNGVLARMDDRYLSLPYRYGYVGHNELVAAIHPADLQFVA